MNNEAQQILRGFHVLTRHSHKREFSEIALLQEMPRIKRQYCGVMMQRHRDNIFEHKREAEFSRNATFVEAGRHFEEMCTGFHGIADCNIWHLQYADYSRAGLEKRSPSSSLFTFPHFQSAMETSHFFRSSPIMRGSGCSRSGKRKFLFNDDARSVRSCTSSGQTRFARRLGGNRVDSGGPVLVSAPTFPVCDWPQYSRYTDAMILPLHSDTLCPMQLSQQRSETSSTSPFMTWRSRRTLENECLPESGGFMGLTNNSLVSQINGLSSGAGFGSRTFQGESFIRPSFIETSRDPFSESYVGAYARRYHSNDGTNVIQTFSGNGRMLNSFEPPGRFAFYRTGRHSPFRESAARSSQSVPTEAFATSSRSTYEAEAALGGLNSPYVPVRERGTPSSVSEYVESGSRTPRSAPSRMPRRRRRQRIIRQQRSSHELLNQSLEYEEVDIDSQHSDMHLDVDDMSYEELLVLGERIGNVETGLSEDSIQKCLKMSKLSSLSGVSSVSFQKNEVLCSICQEEYRENDELGLLACGHSHHPACIKQWLRLKNQCPICKAAAYSEC